RVACVLPPLDLLARAAVLRSGQLRVRRAGGGDLSRVRRRRDARRSPPRPARGRGRGRRRGGHPGVSRGPHARSSHLHRKRTLPDPRVTLVAPRAGIDPTLMSQLSARDRKKLPKSAFAYVDSRGRRRLPIHDESHVRNALARFAKVVFEDETALERARKKLLGAAKKYGIVPIGFMTG